MRTLHWFLPLLLLLLSTSVAQADTITFEDRSDSESVTTQYLNLVFTNATAIKAGISLNEASFPPHSGTTVVFDDGGPMAINFTMPVSSIGGYFTYTTRLTLVAFDMSNNPIMTMMSAFNDNTADGGESGSSPNEFISFSFAGGISRIMITGLPTGNSFVLDDLTFTFVNPASTVPEPATLVLMALGLPALARWRKRKPKLSGINPPTPTMLL